MGTGKGKHTVISLSSSSEEEKDGSDFESEYEEGEEENDDDDDGESDEENSDSDFSGDGHDWSEEEDNLSDQYHDGETDKEVESNNDDDESLCNRIICLLKEGNNLEAVNLKECKAYLRKHGLRIAGTKAVCIQRIKEHWRIKDTNMESLYPRSSFFVNCTGDVCKGDLVMFTQKVYDKFDKVTRHGRLLGTRTVAGRVVKESYGAAKQQHTFTVEVLWSKGIKKLPLLFPLLVKGRNLYKLKTFRQHWSDEAERLKVLAEKHKRGTAARLVRAMKKTKKVWSTDGGAKRQKHFHHVRPLQMRRTAEPEKRSRNVKPMSQQHEKVCNRQLQLGPVTSKQNAKSSASKSLWRHQKCDRKDKDRGPAVQPYASPSQKVYLGQFNFSHRTADIPFSSCDTGSTSTMIEPPPFRPSAHTSMVPAFPHWSFSDREYIHNTHIYPWFDLENRNFNGLREMIPSRHTVDVTGIPFSSHQSFNRSNFVHRAHLNPSYNFEHRE